MTATPIPRSLALTVFGDLSVSVLDELPPGRGRIDTRVVTPANHDAAIDFLANRLAAGGQAYIVCPRVSPDAPDETDASSQPGLLPSSCGGTAPKAGSNPLPLSAEQAYSDLLPRLGRFGVGLVHGQMPRERQQAALADFAAGRIKALVATTVIEVGVDVVRANVMAVLAAERFGLAQLHQLRGRIGRGSNSARSYCLLLTTAEADEAVQRLAILEKTRDGFRIAEEDLARRGPGQFFGPAQHGLPEFRHVDLVKDLPLLRQARRDAFATVADDPRLADGKHAALRRKLLATYGDALPLIDAG